MGGRLCLLVSGRTLPYHTYGAFTLDVKLVLNENLDGINLHDTQCEMDDSLMLSEC